MGGEESVRVVQSHDFGSVSPWCQRNPGGKVILGVKSWADAAAVGKIVPRTWTGTACIVFANEEDKGMRPGATKMMAVARIRLAFARHRCTFSIAQ